MYCYNKSLYLIILRISLGLSLIPTFPRFVLAEPVLETSALSKVQGWRISQSFHPPDRGAPHATAGGGTRSSCSSSANKPLTPLLPITKVGLTLTNQPTFYWFQPPSSDSKTTARFLLQDTQGKSIFETQLNLPKEKGIAGFQPPENAINLKVGQEYHWFLAIPCVGDTDGDELNQQIIEGWVERSPTTPELSQKISQAKPSGLSQVYADNGIWYETLDSLVQQSCLSSPAKAIGTNWEALFKSDSVDLADFLQEPILTCTSTPN